jgi:tetratricopeptide (TPR) repeat protein
MNARPFTIIVLWLAACAVFVGIDASAAEAKWEETFRKGNVAYEQGKYQEAAALYQNLLANGWRSQPIYFNLGNACFKSGKVGDAIFYFRKAREANPRDPDARANLAFARDSIGAQDNAGGELFLLQFATVGELLAVALIMFWVFFILLALGICKPAWKLRVAPWVKTCGALLAISAAAAALAARPHPVAIAAQSEVVALYGPLPESQTAFTVRDGTELNVVGAKRDWVQVRDGRNRVAWVARQAVRLFP